MEIEIDSVTIPTNKWSKRGREWAEPDHEGAVFSAQCHRVQNNRNGNANRRWESDQGFAYRSAPIIYCINLSHLRKPLSFMKKGTMNDISFIKGNCIIFYRRRLSMQSWKEGKTRVICYWKRREPKSKSGRHPITARQKSRKF